MKRIKLLGMLLFTAVIASVKAQEGQFVKAGTMDELFVQAKKENKMVFVDSYFVGCHPCKQMDDEVFVLPEVEKLMEDNFVSTKIDFMTEDLGKKLQVKYAVTGFPTFLLLNADGQLVARFSGYKEADKFQNLLKEAMAKSKKGEAMKGFSSSLDVNYPAFYPVMFTERKPMNADEVAAYLKAKNLLEEGNAIPFLMTSKMSPELADFLLQNYAKLESLYGKDLVWGRRLQVINTRMKAAISTRDDAKFESFLNEVKPLFSTADWPYAKLDIAEEYYYRQQKDTKAFYKYAVANYNDDDNKIRYMAMYLKSPTEDAEGNKLFANWMQLVVSENSGTEVLRTAARIMKEQNEPAKAKQYATWGLKKAKLISKSPKYFESFLN
ncbi:thioredoxin family protein [Pedobacter sp. MC2016-24]|uniref:thioredoxin family protein n=1 Tax=Pedobacter sp. MC2016-24 TaxID=2780090 RepID=UPI00187DF172|nr:thioredoxin family protein [Pedobacter sp. MC2016-24]MBE9598996.1 thioredoxin family protein [Pedobacter sp. MC2016-24]